MLAEETCAVDPPTLRTGRHRVEPLCSVPYEDYQYRARTPSLVVRSLSAVPHHSFEAANKKITQIRQSAIIAEKIPGQPEILPPMVPVDVSLRPESKLLQLANRSLEIAHCEMSDIALKVQPNGSWFLTLRADQNRISKNDELTRSDDIQIKRNAFQLKIRLLDSAHRHQEIVGPGINRQLMGAQSGKVAVAHILVPEFWVQREAPQMVSLSGFDPMIASSFDDIDEAEFEFYVVLDPLTGSGKGVVLPWQRKIGWNSR